MFVIKIINFNHMNEQIKNYFYITVIIVLLIGAFSTVKYVNSYSKASQPSSFRSFNVAGDGKVVAVPDVARFSFGAVTEGGKDIASLQKQNSDKVNKAIAYLKGNGVDEKDITTQNYSVDPRYQYFNCSGEGTTACPPAEIVGYTVNQAVAVKIRDFSKVGNILSGVVENGANTVSQLQFTIDDPTAVQNEARAKAIDKAKAKAEAIAQAGDFKLGRLLSIDEGGASPSAYQDYGGFGYGGGAPMAVKSSPNIEPGSQEINVVITLSYEIK